MNQELININDQLNLKKNDSLTLNLDNLNSNCQLGGDFSDYQPYNIQFDNINLEMIDTSEQDSPILLDKKRKNLNNVFNLS